MPITKEFRNKIVTFYNKKMPKNLFAYMDDKTYVITNKIEIKKDNDKLRLSLMHDDEEVSVQYIDNVPDLKNGDIITFLNLLILQEYKFNNDQLIPFDK